MIKPRALRKLLELAPMERLVEFLFSTDPYIKEFNIYIREEMMRRAKIQERKERKGLKGGRCEKRKEMRIYTR